MLTRLRSVSALGLLVSACGGSGGGSSDGAGAFDSAGSLDGSASDGSLLDAGPGADGASGSGCPVPSAGRLVASSIATTMPPGRITSMAVNGGVLFLHGDEGVYSIPTDGTATTTLFEFDRDDPNGLRNELSFMADGTILAVTGAGAVGTVPRAGGAFTPFAFTLPADGWCGVDTVGGELYVADTPTDDVTAYSLTTGAARPLGANAVNLQACTLLSTGVLAHHTPLVGGDVQALMELPRNGGTVVRHDLAAGAFAGGDGDGYAFLEGLALYANWDSAGSLLPFRVWGSDLAAGAVREVFTFEGTQSLNAIALTPTRLGGVRNHQVAGGGILADVVVIDATTAPANSPIVATIVVNDLCSRYDSVALSDTELFVAQRDHTNTGTNLYAIPF